MRLTSLTDAPSSREPFRAYQSHSLPPAPFPRKTPGYHLVHELNWGLHRCRWRRYLLRYQGCSRKYVVLPVALSAIIRTTIIASSLTQSNATRHGRLSPRRDILLRYPVLPHYSRLLSHGHLRPRQYQVWTTEHPRLCGIQQAIPRGCQCVASYSTRRSEEGDGSYRGHGTLRGQGR